MERIFTLLISLLFSSSAFALILQHDTEPSEFFQFAKEPQFASVGLISGPKGQCTGFLIDSRTVMTAAHCAEKYDPESNEDFRFLLFLNDTIQTFKIDGAKHFDFTFTDQKILMMNASKDIGFFYLESPILGVDLLKLTHHPEPNFDDSSFLIGEIAGFGLNGFANSLTTFQNNAKLAGYVFLTKQKCVHLQDPSCNYTTLLSTMTHEGKGFLGVAPTYGDSGAPVIIRDDYNQPIVIGIVSSANQDPFNRVNLQAFFYRFISQNGFDAPRMEDHSYFGAQMPNYSLNGRYMTSARYAYIGSKIDEIKNAVAVHKVQIGSHERTWSQLSSQLSHMWPKGITNAKQTATSLPVYFHVHIVGDVKADQIASVDLLNLQNNESILSIPSDKSLTALRTHLQKGHLEVKGNLHTEAMKVEGSQSGLASFGGSGKILFHKAPHNSLLEREGYKPDQILWNKSGQLYFENPTTLSLWGNYRHEKEAEMLASIDGEESSLFEVDGFVQLQGGFLQIQAKNLDMFSANKENKKTLSLDNFLDIAPRSFFTHMGMGSQAISVSPMVVHKRLPSTDMDVEEPKPEYRWTILKAKKLSGHFDTLSFNGQIPEGYKAHLEYYNTHLDVALKADK